MKNRKGNCSTCLPLVLFSVLLFMSVVTSCAHVSPFARSEEYYFQALGDADQMVATLDVPTMRPFLNETSLAQAGGDLVLDRADRLSFSMEQTAGNDGSSWNYQGALEGNYSRFLVNAALAGQPDFTKQNHDGQNWFESSYGLKMGIPRNGIILFTSGDWISHYHTSMEERTIRIPGDIAVKMAEAPLGIYVKQPHTMPLLTFDVPIGLLMQTEEAYLALVPGENGIALSSGMIAMKDGKLANSLNILLRSSYITQLRKDGQKVDLDGMKSMFTVQGNLLFFKDYPVPQEQMNRIFSSLSL